MVVSKKQKYFLRKVIQEEYYNALFESILNEIRADDPAAQLRSIQKVWAHVARTGGDPQATKILSNLAKQYPGAWAKFVTQTPAAAEAVASVGARAASGAGTSLVTRGAVQGAAGGAGAGAAGGAGAGAAGGAMVKQGTKSAAKVVGKEGLKRIGAAAVARLGGAGAATAASGGWLAPAIGIGMAAWLAYDVASLIHDTWTEDDDPEEATNKAIAVINAAPVEKAQTAVKKASIYAPGPCKKDKAKGKKLQKAMKDAAEEAGVGSWNKLPYAHPARADFRAWYKCRPIPSEQGGYEEEEEAPIAAAPEEEKEWSNPNLVADANEMYEALKGMGTDEEEVYRILKDNKPDLKALYNEFDKVLARKGDTDAGDLIDWLRDDGENQAALTVKRAMMEMGKHTPGQDYGGDYGGAPQVASAAPEPREDWVGHGIPVNLRGGP